MNKPFCNEWSFCTIAEKWLFREDFIDNLTKKKNKPWYFITLPIYSSIRIVLRSYIP